MESRHVFPAGAGVNGLSNDEDVLKRLRAHAPLGRAVVTRTAQRRGDDDLNPGMLSAVERPIDAAVLVPLMRRPAGLQVLLTRRADHLSDHAGQIAFPGGRIEAWDASPKTAALRETQEEVGIAPDSVDAIAQLDTYLTRTGYRVTPIVGVLDPPERFEPHEYEVAEIFEVPLAFFLDPAAKEMHSRAYNGRERFYYAFPYGDYYIWGATAGILVNLVEVLVQPC